MATRLHLRTTYFVLSRSRRKETTPHGFVAIPPVDYAEIRFRTVNQLSLSFTLSPAALSTANRLIRATGVI